MLPPLFSLELTRLFPSIKTSVYGLTHVLEEDGLAIKSASESRRLPPFKRG